MLGLIAEKMEFLFPDSPLGEMSSELSFVSARNGKVGVQILFQCPEESGDVTVQGDAFDVEYFQMIDVNVNCNTGGSGEPYIIHPEKCPEYAIRKAPFRVYDCLKPLSGGTVPAKNGRVAAYICLSPKQDIKEGEYVLRLQITAGQEKHICKISYKVFPVVIEEGHFDQVTWYSPEAIERQHHVAKGTPEYLEVLRTYAKALHRGRQNVFAIHLVPDDPAQLKEKPYRFTFEKLKPVIDIFCEEGFDTMQVMPLLESFGVFPDGTVDPSIRDMTFAPARQIPVDSEEGYEFFNSYLKDFAAFLHLHEYKMKLLFGVCDEPHGYISEDVVIQTKRKQYFMASGLIRKHFPGVRTIEAIHTTDFRWGQDVMVPITNGYEKNKEFYDKAVELGDEVWVYVCCGPTGYWLNRFLDKPLSDIPLLFWGCAANRLSGYLHWGGNFFHEGQNPFEETSGKNPTGIGSDYPCGDAFIVYPGRDGAWPSMRLEAQRRGLEDVALLSQLGAIDAPGRDQLISKVFHGFKKLYECGAEDMELVHRELLEKLS